MKTYIYQNIEALKRLNKCMDFKAELCAHEWLVFNENGEKEVYIFKNNGRLIISLNGIITEAKWELESVSESLIISTNGKSYLMRPTSSNGLIMALNLDGTNRFAFLVNVKGFVKALPKTYSDVKNYLIEEDSKKKKEEENKKKAEEEKRKKQWANSSEYRRSLWKKYYMKHKRDIDYNENVSSNIMRIFLASAVLATVMIFVTVSYDEYLYTMLIVMAGIAGSIHLISLYKSKKRKVLDENDFYSLPLNERERLANS